MVSKVYRGKDAEILVNSSTIARAQSASCEISTGLESLYEIGSPLPTELEMGNVEITGSIEAVMVDTPLFQLLSNLGTISPPVLTEFDVIFKCSTAAGAPLISLGGCKAETGSIDIPQDGWIPESIDFRGKTYGLIPVV